MGNRWPKPYLRPVTVLGPSTGPIESVFAATQKVCFDFGFTPDRHSVAGPLEAADRAALSETGVIIACVCPSNTPTTDEIADIILTGRELERGAPWDVPLALVRDARSDRHMGASVAPYHPMFGVVTFGGGERQSLEDQLRRTCLHVLSRRNLDRAAHQRRWTDDRHAEGEHSLDEMFSARRLGQPKPISVEGWISWGDGKLFT